MKGAEMKKRTFEFLLYVFALSSVFISCTAPPAQENENSEKINVYYAVVQGAGSLSKVVDCEQVVIPQNAGDKLQYVIDSLFQTPASPKLKSAFPSGSKSVSYKLDNGKLSFTVGGPYGALTDMERTIADSCAVLTLCDYPGVDSVELSAEGALSSSQPVRTLRKSDIVLSDMSLQPIEQDITLYFPDEALRYVEPEKHKIVIRENEQMERVCGRGTD